MTRKRFKPEDIVNKLREADALLSKGQTVAQACKQIGVTRVLTSGQHSDMSGFRCAMLF